ncbi:MAG: type II secretion system protein [Planctomycetota bacterium]|nr:type II secretion system protein [Planctomycetota bacterium]
MVIRRTAAAPFAFTLVELLAVIVIISIVATLSLSAYRSIASDARISMASNAVSSVLDNARAVAIQKRRNVLVAMRPVMVGEDAQQVELVIAVESGDKHVNMYTSQWTWGFEEPMAGFKFVPAEGIKPQLLPKGISVASPVYSLNTRHNGPLHNDTWLSLSNLPAMQGGGQSEAPGVILGIVFDETGAVRTAFEETGSQLAFVDFNNDGGMRCEGNDYCLSPCNFQQSGPMLEGVPEPLADYTCDLGLVDPNGNPWSGSLVLLNYSQNAPSEEPYLLITPMFAIYDYDEARELYPQEDHDWTDPLERRADLDAYAEEFGIVFSFNRYTGTVVK